MKIIMTFLVLPMMLILSPNLYPQDNKSDSAASEITMSNEEWHLKRDQYAVAAIILLRKLEKLDSAIAVLKNLGTEYNNMPPADCDSILLAIVGASKEDYEDFKIKFTETENRISSRSGTPDDARKMYFDEILGSKMRCLPEFSDRYASLKNSFGAWENKKTDEKNPERTFPEGTYIVVKGDNLWKIAEIMYSDPHLWTLIRDANSISRRHLIYPGQVLKIPAVNAVQN